MIQKYLILDKITNALVRNAVSEYITQVDESEAVSATTHKVALTIHVHKDVFDLEMISNLEPQISSQSLMLSRYVMYRGVSVRKGLG